MTSTRVAIAALAVALAVAVPATATAGELDSFLKSLDVRASADLGAFKADLSVSFGVSEPSISGLFQVMSDPSDVYMTLRIGELSRRPVDQVVAEYKRAKGQGWGAIAKNLGIKPGSAEFHALKEGRLRSSRGAVPSGKNGKGKGKG